MNILELNWMLEIGGQERHVIDLSNFLSRQGHHVFVMSKGGVSEKDLNINVSHIKMPFDRIFPHFRRKMLNPINLFTYFCMRQKYFELLAREKIDIIHCHGVAETYFCLKNRVNIPIICSCHGYPNGTWKWHSSIIKDADYFIGVSDFVRKNLDFFVKKTFQTTTINYGIKHVDVSQYPKEIRTLIRKELFPELNSKFPLIVSVARLTEQKGLDVLLKSIPHILRKYPLARFVIVGDGEKRKELCQLAEQLHISDFVRFVGVKKDVYPYLIAADLFCLPSRYEGLPLSIVEAYRAGLPVVVSNSSGNPEIVKEGVTGFVFQTENSIDLALKISCILQNENYRKMKRQALHYSKDKRFDPDYVHGLIEKYYLSILKQESEKGRV